MTWMKRLRHLAGVATLAACSAGFAQEGVPIRIFVGFVPGGTSDIVARMLAEELRQELGRPVLVENKPGVSGRLAAEAVKNAPNDGTAYMFAPDSWAIFPTLLVPPATLRYNYLEDLAPVARVISYPLGLYASKSAGIHNATELVEKARANPQLAMYASAGSGGISEVLGLLLSKSFGVKMTTVPFKGSADVKAALLGGQVPLGIMAPGDILRYTSDKIVPIGFMGAKRWSVAPNIPTLTEQGFNVTQGEAFMGLWASSRTPKAQREVVENAVRKILDKPGFREKLVQKTLEPSFASAAELDQQVRHLLSFWGPILKEAGVKP